MNKHIILFLAANRVDASELALGQEARAIQEELERSGQRDRFEFVTRWAVRPLDLIRELRRLEPTVVHFSGRGRTGGRRPNDELCRDVTPVLGGAAGAEYDDHRDGLFFQRPDGQPQFVTAAALRATFQAAGASVRLVVLNACYSNIHAEALLGHVDCVVGIRGSLCDDAARAFTIGFYGGLGERQSVAAAYLQGCAAISLEESGACEVPQLRARDDIDAGRVFLVERPPPVYPDAEAEQLSKRIKDAQMRRDKLRGAGVVADRLDREILELRRQLREGGKLRAGDTSSDGRDLNAQLTRSARPQRPVPRQRSRPRHPLIAGPRRRACWRHRSSST